MKLVSQRVERMIRGDDLGEPEARKPHEAAAAAPAREIVDELDRGAIAPMQILRHQQQRTALGVAVQEFAHFTEHPFQVDADELSQQGFALFGGTEPGQLQQPGGRDGAQQSVVLLYQRDTAPRVLRVLGGTARRFRSAARNGHVRRRCRRARKQSDRSASSCQFRARPRSRTRRACRSSRGPRRAKRCKFFRSTDEQSVRRVRRCAPRDVATVTAWLAPTRGCQDGDEPITPAWDGFYEARLLRIVVENHPDIADGAFQHRVADEAVAPDLIEQGVLRQQCAGMTGESTQQSEGRRRKRERAAAAKQAVHSPRRARTRRSAHVRGSSERTRRPCLRSPYCDATSAPILARSPSR